MRGMTTIVIAITVDTPSTGTFHPAAVKGFLKGWEESGLPIRSAQDVRFHNVRYDEVAHVMNRIALKELDPSEWEDVES